MGDADRSACAPEHGHSGAGRSTIPSWLNSTSLRPGVHGLSPVGARTDDPNLLEAEVQQFSVHVVEFSHQGIAAGT